MAGVKGFGGRVYRARLRLQAELGREVTTAEIGEKLGVTGVTVARWERGVREPDLATIVQLAAALGVSAAHLAFGDGEGQAGAGPAEAAPRPADRGPRRPRSVVSPSAYVSGRTAERRAGAGEAGRAAAPAEPEKRRRGKKSG